MYQKSYLHSRTYGIWKSMTAATSLKINFMGLHSIIILMYSYPLMYIIMVQSKVSVVMPKVFVGEYSVTM